MIGDVLKVGNGKDYKHLAEGDIPVFGTGGYMLSVNDFLYDGDSVFIGRKGTINKPFFYSGKFWTVDTLFYTHSFNKVIPHWKSAARVTPEAQVPLTPESIFRMTPIKS